MTGTASTRDLPRLLYVSDVAVEPTTGGEALLHRLFREYPADRLCFALGNLTTGVQGFEKPPSGDLPGRPRQVGFRVGWGRPLSTRFSREYAALLALTAAGRRRRVMAVAREFKPEAILSVMHSFSWITAASLAEQLRIPLHLILHDEWTLQSPMPRFLRAWSERLLGNIYRQAVSRLCVSPYAAECYERRFAAAGSVLYPSRGLDSIVHDAPAEPLRDPDAPMVVGYAGSLHVSGYAEGIVAIAAALEPVGGRVLIHCTMRDDSRRRMGLDRPNIEVRPFVAPNLLGAILRKECSVLFCPMSFDPAEELAACTSFPSKLTDYTAVGLPLLIWGPPYASVVRWATDNAPIAEVVDTQDPQALAQAVHKLRDPEYRYKMAEAALAAGRRFFSYEAARDLFFDAVRKRST